MHLVTNCNAVRDGGVVYAIGSILELILVFIVVSLIIDCLLMQICKINSRAVILLRLLSYLTRLGLSKTTHYLEIHRYVFQLKTIYGAV